MSKHITPLLLLPALVAAGCLHVDLGSLLSTQQYQERVIEDHEASAKIALITVTGMMETGDDSLLVETPDIVASTKEQLELAAKDEDVKGVLLRISSSGGAIYPSLALTREVLRFREKTKKPVIAYVPDLAASGGYMVASAAGEIVCDAAGLTGGIGVIAFFTDMSGVIDWAKINVITFKEGKFKDTGSPFRQMTDEEKAMIQGFISRYYTQFKTTVVEGRAKLSGNIDAVADGMVRQPEEALAMGLIDAIGDIYAAHDRVAKSAGLTAETTNLIAYRRPGQYHGSVYLERSPVSAGSAQSSSQMRLDFSARTPGLLPGKQGSFLYLWTWGN